MVYFTAKTAKLLLVSGREKPCVVCRPYPQQKQTPVDARVCFCVVHPAQIRWFRVLSLLARRPILVLTDFAPDIVPAAMALRGDPCAGRDRNLRRGWVVKIERVAERQTVQRNAPRQPAQNNGIPACAAI